ncbi:MAG: hypothetical protein ACJA06_000597 [Halocynthiibacter sp.]|jgi:hypothetical protein
MTRTVTPLRHARLMHGMAEKLGLDLEAEPPARLSKAALADMTARCDACTNHDACILWMLENDTGAQTPPAYCPNAQDFARLKG